MGLCAQFSSALLAFRGAKEQDAHELLVDFLCETSLSLSRLTDPITLQMIIKPLLHVAFCVRPGTSESDIEVDSIAEMKVCWGWDWTATDEIQVPEIDRYGPRGRCRQNSGAIGTYRSGKGHRLASKFSPDFDGWS
jgi:hypothetical protein